MRRTVCALFLLCSSAVARETASTYSTNSSSCNGTGLAAAACEHFAGFRENAAGNTSAAEAHYRTALDLWKGVNPRRPDLESTTLINLSDTLSDRNMDEALALLREAQRIAPASEMPSVLGHLAALYCKTADPERGRAFVSEALHLFEASASPDKPEFAYAWNTLGMLDLGAGNYTAAEESFHKAHDLSDSSEGVYYESNIGLALYAEGRYHQAEVVLERALPKATGRQRAPLLSHLAAVNLALKRFGTAEDLAEQALAGLRHDFAPDSPEVIAMEVTMASVYLGEHKTKDAARILPEAVRRERAMSIDPRLQADAIRRLADLRAQQKQWSEAESLYREAIRLYEQRLGPSHPDIAILRREFAIAIHAKTSHPA